MNWVYRFDVADIFHVLSGSDLYVEVARRMRQRFQDLLEADGEGELPDLIEHAEDVDEFDAHWSEFYDWADARRVWVVTR